VGKGFLKRICSGRISGSATPGNYHLQSSSLHYQPKHMHLSTA